MRIDKSQFKSDAEYFAYVVANKEQIITLKKAATKFTDCDMFNPIFVHNIHKGFATKADEDIDKGIIKRTIVGNTYNWMDSHNDVHIKGIFTKSIQESQKSILHLHDHEYKVTSKVGTPIEVYEKEMLWSELGIAKAGTTTSLLMDTEIKKSFNAMIFDEYVNKQINQHSVGMIYVKLMTCVNDAKYKEEFANWQTYFPMVGNPDKAQKEGVFWAVTEAKLKEISCVIQGSNELTPTLEPNKITPQSEPAHATQKKINYQNLLNHLN